MIVRLRSSSPAKPTPTTLVRRPAFDDAFARDSAKTQGRRLVRTRSGNAIGQLDDCISGETTAQDSFAKTSAGHASTLGGLPRRLGRDELAAKATRSAPARNRLREVATAALPDAKQPARSPPTTRRELRSERPDSLATIPRRRFRYTNSALPPGGGSLTARISCVAGEPRPCRPTTRW